ncbi:MAG: prolyl oligopeptidase family serine peptidase [Bacteroidales bacterium]|nr:prolyl oligopeptidase family serine peptidase [Bacteroidales bacterium]
MGRKILLALLLWAVAVCATAAETVRYTMKYKGETRTYWLYVPEGADAGTPLVLVLHGYGGKAEGYCPAMLEVAEREGFAVCYPQGEKDAKGKTGWNVGYDVQQGLQRDDVGFVKALVKHVRKTHHVGRDNVFMSGMSNGGEMTYFMAYKYPDLFRAYASIAGLTMQWAFKDWKAKKPVPLMEVHGTADKTSMWEGDPTDTGGWGAYVAVPLAVGYWAAQARCTHEETVTLPRKGDHPVVLHRYLGGDDGIEVRLYEVQGAKHSWHLADMDTCREMWAFFRQYMR